MQTSPKSAKAVGDTYYFTGKPCPRGHTCKRFASTHACVECLAAAKQAYRSLPENNAKEIESGKAYRKANASRLRAERLARYREDPSKRLAASSSWKKRNVQRVADYCSAYKKARPGENAARAAKYLAAKAAATPLWADLKAIREIYVLAEKLTKETGIKHEVDHVHPLSGRQSCGLHVHYNLRPIPARLNRIKYNKVLDDVAGS